MRRILLSVTGSALCTMAGAYMVLAQTPATQPDRMSFFVTSASLPGGANLGGLAGGDRHCSTTRDGGGRGPPHVARLSERAGTPGPTGDQRTRPDRKGPLVQRERRDDRGRR